MYLNSSEIVVKYFGYTSCVIRFISFISKMTKCSHAAFSASITTCSRSGVESIVNIDFVLKET